MTFPPLKSLCNQGHKLSEDLNCFSNPEKSFLHKKGLTNGRTNKQLSKGRVNLPWQLLQCPVQIHLSLVHLCSNPREATGFNGQRVVAMPIVHLFFDKFPYLDPPFRLARGRRLHHCACEQKLWIARASDSFSALEYVCRHTCWIDHASKPNYKLPILLVELIIWLHLG